VKGFSQYMVDIFFCYFMINPASDLEVGTFTAIPKTMISFKMDFFRKTMLGNISLDDFKHGIVPSGKTGTAQTYYNLTPMIHGYC
jgi:hypothetical protein